MQWNLLLHKIALRSRCIFPAALGEGQLFVGNEDKMKLTRLLDRADIKYKICKTRFQGGHEMAVLVEMPKDELEAQLQKILGRGLGKFTCLITRNGLTTEFSWKEVTKKPRSGKKDHPKEDLGRRSRYELF